MYVVDHASWFQTRAVVYTLYESVRGLVETRNGRETKVEEGLRMPQRNDEGGEDLAEASISTQGQYRLVHGPLCVWKLDPCDGFVSSALFMYKVVTLIHVSVIASLIIQLASSLPRCSSPERQPLMPPD